MLKSLQRISLIMCIMLTIGCSALTPYDATYQTLLVSKETILFIVRTAKDLHTQKVIDDLTLSKIRDAYERIKNSQDLVITTQNLILTQGQTAENLTQLEMATRIYLRTVTEYVRLAIDIGILNPSEVTIGGPNG